LIVYQPQNIWNETPTLADDGLSDWFEIQVIHQIEDAEQHLGNPQKSAFCGPQDSFFDNWKLGERNPSALQAELNWARAYKSEYEQVCISRANQISAEGHIAAKDVFYGGGSEFEIKMAFAQGCQQSETELAYPSVVALNQHASILHYAKHSHAHFDDSQLLSFLIDAGAQFNGYAADVSRTYAFHDGTFKDCITGLDATQRRIISEMKPGQDYFEQNRKALLLIANLLVDIGLVKTDPQTAMDLGLIQTFMPHSLGHFIGAQVHDVGGNYINSQGHIYQPQAHLPTIKMGRTIEPNQVVTVEPGIYFIDAILNPLTQGQYRKSIDWELVEYLKPYGGMRIEDNILITEQGVNNLTRQAFECLNTRREV
jgi:Xaa-Pro dipeptidase